MVSVNPLQKEQKFPSKVLRKKKQMLSVITLKIIKKPESDTGGAL